MGNIESVVNPKKESLLPVIILARDLDEAWHAALKLCFMYGYEWVVESGSYKGQKRYEFDSVEVHIKDPGNGPLVPTMPEGSGLTPPTSREYVENYFATYLMSAEKTEHEDYTYGERLVNPRLRFVERPKREDKAKVTDGPLMRVNQIEEIIKEIIFSKGNSNQTCMEIAMPNDVLLNDPPCLRLIDVRVRYGRLHLFVYFRSWDLYAGFPANLGALELLKQYMVQEINQRSDLNLRNGSIVAFSKGLHIYEQYYPVVEARLGKTKEELRREGRESTTFPFIVYDGIRDRFS